VIDEPGFQKMKAHIRPEAVGMLYMNPERFYGWVMNTYVAYGKVILAMASAFSGPSGSPVKIEFGLVPRPRAITQHLEGTVAAVYPTSKGTRLEWRSTSLSPTSGLVVAGTAAAHIYPYITAQEARTAQRRCEANLQDIAFAVNMYAADHEGRIPDGLDGLVPKYIGNAEKLRCPFTEEHAKYSLAVPGRELRKFEATGPVVLAHDSEPHGEMITAVFTDWHIEVLSQADFARKLDELKTTLEKLDRGPEEADPE
jgi:hypothetical protein